LRGSRRQTARDLKHISEILPHGVAAGARYPQVAMEMVNR